MGKPFKLKGGEDNRANVGRERSGKFTRLENPTGLEQKASDQGEFMEDVARAERVPDHPITASPQKGDGGDVVYQETHPWSEAGPTNDGNKTPMKLRG